MIVDVHTHIFSSSIRNHRENYFDSEPNFKRLYSLPGSKLAGVEDLIRSMDEHGVHRSVTFSFPWTQSDTFRRENDYIIESVNRYPDRLIGLCCFDPFNQDAVSETLRGIEAGLSGVGELAFYHSGFDDACIHALKPIMEICRDKNAPVVIHTNEPIGHAYAGKAPMTCGQIYRLIETFPDNDMILAHWGGGIFFYNLLKKEVKERMRRVWFDTAASPYLYDPEIYRIAVQIVGKDRILFGSDYPLIKPARYFKEMEAAGLSSEDRAAVCGNNAVQLFNGNTEHV